MNLDAAYAECERITHREAKNFSYGIRLLHPPERRALSAVYALARRIDDIGDGEMTTTQKLKALSRVRKDLGHLDPAGDDAVMVAVADGTKRYGLPIDAFGELIDGCEMDVMGASYVSFEDLLVYCRRVAGTIGRLSLAVFGSADTEGAVSRADALGVALQLTNILRDITEDRDMGRIYLPAQDAWSVGCPADLSGSPDQIAALVALECPRAREWFERGLELLPLLERRARACVSAMAGIYHRLLERIERDPMAVTRTRVSLPPSEKLWVAVRALAGAGV